MQLNSCPARIHPEYINLSTRTRFWIPAQLRGRGSGSGRRFRRRNGFEWVLDTLFSIFFFPILRVSVSFLEANIIRGSARWIFHNLWLVLRCPKDGELGQLRSGYVMSHDTAFLNLACWCWRSHFLKRRATYTCPNMSILWWWKTERDWSWRRRALTHSYCHHYVT